MIDLKPHFLPWASFLLYAEIHSRFSPLPNILNNRRPEIVADAPYRTGRNHKIPLLILVKDAHLYPVELTSIKVRLHKGGEMTRDEELLTEPLSLARRIWSRLYEIDPEAEGPVDLEVTFSGRRNNKAFVFRSHSYPWVRKTGLHVYVSPDELPDSRRVAYGDVHYHSHYTEDVVEFGAPVEAAAKMAAALGLSFFAVTDHSYDLEGDLPDSARNDPGPRKWPLYLAECASSIGREVAVLPGIELSAGNGKGRNVHLLILNPDRFRAGRGDSGKNRLKNKPDASVAEVLNGLGPEELPIAAHPFQKLSFPERWLLRRGVWRFGDIREENLAGLQIFNGRDGRDLMKSLKKWTKVLGRGERKFIYAGNDAHGDFNRQIRIGIPFLRLKNKSAPRFGFMKTGLLAEGRRDRKTILAQLRGGRCFVTTGPSILFHLSDNEAAYGPGDEARGRGFELSLGIKSIGEFGVVTSVSIILGDLAARTETSHIIRASGLEFAYHGPLPFRGLPRRGYIRIECRTERGMAFSNPVWIAESGEGRPPVDNAGPTRI